MSPPCESCEFQGDVPVCHARAIGHRRYCRLIALGSPGYRELVRERTLAGPPSPVSTYAAQSPPPRDTEADRRIMALCGAAEACPDRVEIGEGCCARTSCGPDGMRPGDRVNIHDCLACCLVRGIESSDDHGRYREAS